MKFENLPNVFTQIHDEPLHQASVYFVSEKEMSK